MNSLLKYKNYFGTVEHSVEDNCLYGKLAYIRDLVTYEGNTVKELVTEFERAVNDYLFSCKQERREPDIPCKGTFNVRPGPKRHRAVILALKEDQKLNTFIIEAIDEKLARLG